MITDAKLKFWIDNNLNVLFSGHAGTGKCLGKGTNVLMFDGSIKPVEKIKPNDLLMGVDSKPRTVLSITCGIDTMYKIIPKRNGKFYTCNSEHILSLKSTVQSYGCIHNEIKNISVMDFLNLSKNKQKYLTGYRIGVEFLKKSIKLDPYFLGLWLGDGSSDRPLISTSDFEIVNYLNKLITKKYKKMFITSRKKGNCDMINLHGGRINKNEIKNELRSLNLLHNKHIPDSYKLNNRKNRLNLLAGLLDSDGTSTCGYFVICTKFDKLNDDICFLARSLGFGVNSRMGGKDNKYHIISITGDTYLIPTKIKRKQQLKYFKKRDSQKFGFKVEKIGVGEYFGFELDLDGLFLLEDFTVTHNSSIILNSFKKHNLRYKYFSASTLDPWVDMIGIPKEKMDVNGNSYLELIRPEGFCDDSIEAIFIDEFNRSPKKVRNAVMELLQFKSINGKKFNNLRFVWAAINPDDKIDGSDELEYDVERLDPAQKDRFEVHVDVPYKPDKGFFLKKFGEDLCDNAIDWWNDLDDKSKRSVSPRRLEYALNVYVKNGDIRDVLPGNVNVMKLITELKNGSYVKLMKSVFEQGNTEEAKKFMEVRNNFDNTISRIIKSDQMLKFFIPCIKEEDLVNIMADEKKVYDHVVDNPDVYDQTIKNILDANTNGKLSKKLKKEPKLVKMAQDLKSKAISDKFETLTYSNANLQVKPVVKNQYGVQLSSLSGRSYTNFINDKTNIDSAIRKGTAYRVGIYHKILSNITERELESDYMETLRILSDIVSSCHIDTFKHTSYKGFAELYGFVIYHCVKSSNGKETSQSIMNKIRLNNNRTDKLEAFLYLNSKLYV